ncbi:MAG: hypothetical protein ACI93S_000554 [Ancylomarina sp.]|jgi:hypothetical protein
MEEEKTAIQELKEFAKKTKRDIDCDDKAYAATGVNPRILVKQHAIISNLAENEAYFVNYCDMAAFGDSAMYSGFFFPVEFPSSTLIKVHQRNILDKMNIFSKKPEFKTQSKKFDSKVVIEENDERASGKLFYSQGIQSLILEIFKLDPRLKLCINHIDTGIVPDLKNKSTLGVYITEQWLLDEQLIEKLFALVGKLKKKIQIGHS